MTFFDIPVGPASVFMMILIGYFVMTVWFGKVPQPIVQKISKPQPPLKGPTTKEERARELNVG